MICLEMEEVRFVGEVVEASLGSRQEVWEQLRVRAIPGQFTQPFALLPHEFGARGAFILISARIFRRTIT